MMRWSCIISRSSILRTGGTVFAVEALARWEHPSLGRIAPATFIPLAESAGLMMAFGDWTLRRACRDVPAVLNEQCARIAINVSISQLLDLGFLNAVHAALDEARLDPACFMIEVTESVFAGGLDRVCEVLATLRRLGMTVAIDDFGAGYSSLAYLSRLPIDALKIDGAFMRDFNRQGGAIIASTLDMAQRLGIDATVEGIENGAMLEQALSVGAAVLQGFHFSRPLAPSAIGAWLKQACIAHA